MKTRQGFISNSSSSSFIIKGGDIEEISLSMLDTVLEYKEEFGKNKSDSKLKKNLKNALNLIKMHMNDIGIMIPSCNEDTYIAKHDGTLYISTCNNHDWDINARDVEYDEEGYRKVQEVLSKKFFFDIRTCKMHSSLKPVSISMGLEDQKFVCDECKNKDYYYYETPDGNKVCEECIQKEVNKPSKRDVSFICPVNGKKCTQVLDFSQQ